MRQFYDRAKFCLLALTFPAVTVGLSVGRAPGFMQAVVLQVPQNERCWVDHAYSNHSGIDFAASISIATLPKPQLSDPSTALVRVAASTVNPADWEGRDCGSDPSIPGLDVAGIIEETTRGCHLRAGGAVWGMGYGGCNAEYVVVPCSRLALKPPSLTLAQAAAVPTVALTSLKAFQRVGAPWHSKPTVLITAGAGGVGSVAIQLAKALGAGLVVTTCSPEHESFVMSLGADRTIDYHTSNWWETLEPGSVDVILDVIPQYGDGKHAEQTLAHHGQYLQLLYFGLDVEDPTHCKALNFMRYGEPDVRNMCTSLARSDISLLDWELHAWDSTDLDFLGDLVAQEKLAPVIDSVYDFHDASQVFEASQRGHSTGKLVIQFAHPPASALHRRSKLA
mmetsp:Transcript_128619/g.274420  ORF Transcript_128619/g.274420 Transcript_128619/m.274420 type:complete len:393 (-) Transcript_128619:71-1249(-)